MESRDRRGLLLFAGGFVAVGAAYALYPILSGLAPRERPVRAEVELSTISAGQTRVLAGAERPILVRHRTREETDLSRQLDRWRTRDRMSRNENLDPTAQATDDNRTLPGLPRWLAVYGVCTHTPCRLVEMETAERIAERVGWLCPCCASRYDLAGRVVSGPAPMNLAIPKLRIEGTRLAIL